VVFGLQTIGVNSRRQLGAGPCGIGRLPQYNFSNVVMLLQLSPTRSRVLDVACGGGWVSHFLMRLGYATFGFDIAPDFVELARELHPTRSYQSARRPRQHFL